ncbi:MAG: DUF4124 domain-containing protein [Deltaproteobacteria bacterium]|nr:DUF4124 domain-containing protein [Deltaproteobacteria bacterium]
MKSLLTAMAIVVLLAANAYADIYQWEDKSGAIHMTDSMEKVPQEYRRKVTVRITAPQEKSSPSVAPATTGSDAGAPPSDAAQELYGDKPLEWWKGEFGKRTKEITKLETDLDAKRQFISIFEKGRRLGQIFEKKDIETYERYKKEVVEDEANIAKWKGELDELRRQATFAGVPREVRGE